VESPLNDLPLL